jgi:hypothetical protein
LHRLELCSQNKNLWQKFAIYRTFWYSKATLNIDNLCNCYITWLQLHHSNTSTKSIILTCHTDFALISTEYIRWGCNFTWSTTMHIKFFVFYWLTSKNVLEKYFLHLKVKLSLFLRIFVWIYFKTKNIFFLSIFWGWSIKYKQISCASW